MEHAKKFFRSETIKDSDLEHRNLISEYGEKERVLLYEFLNRPYRHMEPEYFVNLSNMSNFSLEDIKESLDRLESRNHITNKSEKYSLNLGDETSNKLWNLLTRYLVLEADFS